MRRDLSLLSALLFGFFAFGPPVQAAPAPGVPAPAELREEHAALKAHLQHVRDWAGELAAQAPAQQRETMKRIVDFFQGHIAPHAAEEERGLYSKIDAITKTDGKDRFTTSMRYEHGVVGRWIGELAQEAKRPAPDVKAFTRRTDNLLGLLEAHFEEEEHVLLPILERHPSR